MILIIGLSVSIGLNILLLWYLKKVLERLMLVSDNIGGLFDSVSVYREHVKSIYELEVFYGDETLESLINHTKELYEELEQFEPIYSLTDTDDYVEEEGELDGSDDDDEEEAA